MQITFDTSNPSDMAVLNRLFPALSPSAPVATPAQPEVAQNAGSAASVHPVSSFAEGSAVSEPGAEQSAPAASVKRGRKPKAEAVAQPAADVPQITHFEPEAAAEAAPEMNDGQQELPLDEQPAEPAKALSVDEVRAALQQFTAAKGVPAGVALLKEFGAGRISELDASNYAAFVARCAA